MWMEKTYDQGPYPVTFHVRFSRLTSTTNQGLHVFAIENNVGLELLAQNPYLTKEMATTIFERVTTGEYPVDDEDTKNEIIRSLFTQPPIYFNAEAAEKMITSGVVTEHELQEALFFHKNVLFQIPLIVFLLIARKALMGNPFKFLTDSFVEVIYAREDEIKQHVHSKYKLPLETPLNWALQIVGIPLPKQVKAA